MRKLKAFTILELIVALAISSVLISIGYYSVLVVFKMFKGNVSQSQEITAYYLFKKTLDNDFRRCDFAGEGSDSPGLLLRSVKDSNRIAYEFRKNYIIRQMNNAVDTFHIQTSEFETGFYSNNIKLIKHISLIHQLDGKPVRSIYTKRYSAFQVLAFENQNHE